MNNGYLRSPKFTNKEILMKIITIHTFCVEYFAPTLKIVTICAERGFAATSATTEGMTEENQDVW